MNNRAAVALGMAVGMAPCLAFGDANNTGYGTNALLSGSASTRNSAFGRDALEVIVNGADNTAVGFQAMQLGDSSKNTALGALAGLWITGNHNVAVGYNTMSGSAEGANGGTSHYGSYNTALGANAMAAPVTTDSSNYVTAIGYGALNHNVTDQNTALGGFSLFYNSTGANNTALGYEAMTFNTVGSNNTAVGWLALFTAIGSDNTAVGHQALRSTQSDGSTAVGSYALLSNTTGTSNTALGMYTASQTTTGSDNVAIGSEALRYNTTGSQNMALGRSALRNSTSGGFNSSIGYASCWSCKSASQNVGIGFKTLYSLGSGTSNIAVGYAAGYNLTGSNNVDIANTGMSADSGVIRIGAPGTQTKAYISGIVSSKVTGAPVYVTSDGQLGTQASALRYKTQVQSLQDPAQRLARLRPVSFHLKSDPTGTVQYGLIAEEVARVYPELVIRDEQGVTQGVRYDELAPMLLKQLQGLQQTVTSQGETMRAQTRQIDSLQMQAAELKGLKARLAALESTAEKPGTVLASR